MTWYHPALAQRALDAGDTEIASLNAERDDLIRALQSIAGIADNLQGRIAKEALLGAASVEGGGMRDVLERLEILAAWLKPGGQTPVEPIPDKYSTLVEAISEIKRLRTSANFKQVFDFLNSIEGAGYGGMAEFEIARETMRRSSPVPSKDEK